MTDWATLKEEMGGSFKNFAEDGKYEAKCDGIEIKEVGQNGSIIMKFHLEDGDGVQYPTIDHWLTFKEGKDNWRKWHNRCLMVVLGASEDNAEKVVDICESKSGKEAITKAYEQAFKKLLAKKPTIKFEVFTENNYARADFLDRSVAFSRDNNTTKKDTSESILEQGEEIELEGDLPF